MLIKNAEIWQHGFDDVRIDGARIVEIGTISPQPGEHVIDAKGGALLPGLHDHHIHLNATAVARHSVLCGPPEVCDHEALASVLAAPGQGWLRGIGYHESVAGMLDAAAIDRMQVDRPVRIQHRGGRMWFLNSRAIELLLACSEPPPGLKREGNRWTGQLFDEDAWLRRTLAGSPPDLTDLSRDLARFGITGVTDMTPDNDAEAAANFSAQYRRGSLQQNVIVAGRDSLCIDGLAPVIRLGPVKLHLHESALPEFDATIELIRRAHAAGRATASHCVTRVELTFALAALQEAGCVTGDRIEHAGVATDELVEQIAVLGLQVVSNPAFIAERGDSYLANVDVEDRPFLYRLASFTDAGVTLAAGSDGPYGSVNPWVAIQAAIDRKTSGGQTIGSHEAMTAETAVALYLADPCDLTRTRKIAVGGQADLCLLDRCWSKARDSLDTLQVRMTIGDGSVIHDCVDQAPL